MAKFLPWLLIILGALIIFISVIINKWSIFGPMTIFLVVGLGTLIVGVYLFLKALL